MAYQTGVATDHEDLMDALSTFLVGEGWTSDNFDSGNKRMSLHSGTVYVSFRWDATDAIALYHALGYSGAAPGSNTDDSGNGQTAANPLTTGRRIQRIGTGPFTAYHFFADSNYCHVVLEYAIGLYRFMSFGDMEKRGSWTGGEYASASQWAASVSVSATSHYALVDWRHNVSNANLMTVHMESMPNQAVGGKWGVLGPVASPGTDRGGTARAALLGGVREGFFQTGLGWLAASASNGFVPMFPLHVYYRRTGVTPEEWRLLGQLPAIRFVNIKYLNPGEEFTIGGDVWKVFPWVRKSETTDADESGHMGFAILKT